MRVQTSPTSRFLGVLILSAALVVSTTPVSWAASGQSSFTATQKKKKKTPPKKGTTGATAKHGKGRKTSRASHSAQTARIHQAFVASSELRPMAQQLITLRTPTAYSGVTNYARSHTGDAAAAAWLSLGFAYQQDKRYSDAVAALRQAKQLSDVLDDYADYLGAMNLHVSGNDSAAETMIKGFAGRYPDSSRWL